jgi:hypothetical protein
MLNAGNVIGNSTRRGLTYCTGTWGCPKDKGLIKVEFNNKGQPIGKKRKKLSSFLGTIARNGKHAPLNYSSWSKMPNTYKKGMIEIVKVILQFSTPPIVFFYFRFFNFSFILLHVDS